jgi:hypothetical protein
MSNTTEKIHTLVEKLSPQDQQQVLDLIEELSQMHRGATPVSELPPGTPGKALLDLRFSLSPEEVDSMEKAIEDCERIDPDEHWLSA